MSIFSDLRTPHRYSQSPLKASTVTVWKGLLYVALHSSTSSITVFFRMMKSCNIEQLRKETISAASQASRYQCKCMFWVWNVFLHFSYFFLQEFPPLRVRSSLLETPKLLPLCSGLPPKRAETSWAIMWIAVWLAPRSGPHAITGPISTPGNFFIHTQVQFSDTSYFFNRWRVD